MSMLGTFVLAAVAIGATMLAMAVGVLMRRPCLRGSCGGPKTLGDGQTIACTGCRKRDTPQLHRIGTPAPPPVPPPGG